MRDSAQCRPGESPNLPRKAQGFPRESLKLQNSDHSSARVRPTDERARPVVARHSLFEVAFFSSPPPASRGSDADHRFAAVPSAGEGPLRAEEPDSPGGQRRSGFLGEPTALAAGLSQFAMGPSGPRLAPSAHKCLISLNQNPLRRCPLGELSFSEERGPRRSSPRLGSTLLGKEGEGKRCDLLAGGLDVGTGGEGPLRVFEPDSPSEVVLFSVAITLRRDVARQCAVFPRNPGRTSRIRSRT